MLTGSAFVPKPEVDVGVVTFVPLKKPLTNHNFKFFEKINRHLFCFRQKYCIKSAG
jgi:dimethyladenosine transferase 1